MKTRHILLIAILFLCSISVFGQAKQNSSANNTKAIAEKVQILEISTQDQISQLQNENKILMEQLQRMGNEVNLYREDVRTKVSEMNSNMSDWLTILTVIMTLVSIVIPIIMNLWNNSLQKEKIKQLQFQLTEIKKDTESAKNDSSSAKESLEEVKELKNEVTLLKEKVGKSEEKARRSAAKALINKLYTEASAEHEKNPQKAISLYTQIIRLDKNNVGAYNNRGALKVDLGNFEGAMQDLNKAIDLTRNDCSPYVNRANLKRKLEDYNGAMKDFNKAIELNPTESELYNYRGILKTKLEDINGAIEDFNKAIELSPNDSGLYFNRAILRSKSEDDYGAIDDYTKSIDIENKNPKVNDRQLESPDDEYKGCTIDYERNANAYNNIADIWLKKEDLGKALENINKAIRMVKNPIYFMTRGEIYMAMAYYSDAIKEFTFALSLEDTAEEAYKLRGKCFRELAKKARGKKKSEYTTLAEADEKKYEELNKTLQDGNVNA